MRHFTALSAFCVLLLAQLACPSVAFAAGGFSGPVVANIPVEFILFAAVLFFIAFVHVNTMVTAVTGALIISVYKIVFSPFGEGTGVGGLVAHFGHEWVILGNLLALLLGFALLAKHFERSEIPAVLPNYMPDDWKGGFVLLVLVFVISSFLDNIAAAMIGGAVAHTVFRGKVHIGYLAGIVAASNAGGAGSVVGDTTTTMMWIAGVTPGEVFEAYIAATVALLITAIPASLQQHAYSPITKDAQKGARVDWTRVAIVAFILVAAICANLLLNLKFNEWSDAFPFLGLAVWVAILLSAPLRRPDWNELPGALRGSIFLLSLVWCASMMPVEKLPEASWMSALALGFVSAVFDNIPLTALALKQGGFDWGFLAYAVGFGGSMIWFGSSAGVALSNMYPESKSVTLWLKHGWHVLLAYVVGFFVLLTVWHWHPGSQLRGAVQPAHEAKTVSALDTSVQAAPTSGIKH
ncbi:citrate transporter [Noviherbaspirillum sp.]|uniref:citrate transporter n=1 Tax=Noviherbaspirillum sp. TaxID=1926288 RepID=UPI002B479EBF|nr:citrate transporter [Noviherbaspirillum sp.]HJV82265.1 citrate transporter [Noviherbaspirillum sp.]